jgi:hypothetical protein
MSWFKKSSVLTAEKAYRLAKINEQKWNHRRRIKLLEDIASAVENGHYSLSFGGASYRILSVEDQAYLQSLGYNIKITPYCVVRGMPDNIKVSWDQVK